MGITLGGGGMRSRGNAPWLLAGLNISYCKSLELLAPHSLAPTVAPPLLSVLL